MSNNTNEAAKQSIDHLEKQIATLTNAIKNAGMDLCPCRLCGHLVICIPDGLPICKDCLERVGA
jgi:hypothetical protein